MIIPNLIFRGSLAFLAENRLRRLSELGRSLTAEFASALELGITSAAFQRAADPLSIRAERVGGSQLLRAGSDGIGAITSANPNLFSAMVSPPSAATVGSWQWIT